MPSPKTAPATTLVISHPSFRDHPPRLSAWPAPNNPMTRENKTRFSVGAIEGFRPSPKSEKVVYTATGTPTMAPIALPSHHTQRRLRPIHGTAARAMKIMAEAPRFANHGQLTPTVGTQPYKAPATAPPKTVKIHKLSPLRAIRH